MSILSGIFSSDSSEDHSSNLLSVIDSALSVDASNQSYDQTTHSDGSSHTSYDSNSFDTKFEASSLVHNMFDNLSDSDSHSGGLGFL